MRQLSNHVFMKLYHVVAVLLQILRSTSNNMPEVCVRRL